MYLYVMKAGKIKLPWERKETGVMGRGEKGNIIWSMNKRSDR